MYILYSDSSPWSYILCSVVDCILYSRFYLLRSMFYIRYSLFCFPYSIFYILFMFYILYSTFDIRCSLFFICSIFYVLYSELYSMFYILDSMFYVLYYMFYVLCSMQWFNLHAHLRLNPYRWAMTLYFGKPNKCWIIKNWTISDSYGYGPRVTMLK